MSFGDRTVIFKLVYDFFCGNFIYNKGANNKRLLKL